MNYTNLMTCLNRVYDSNINVEVEMSDSLLFVSNENTGSFESDNGLELDDPNYVEYYAVGIQLTKILEDPLNKYEEGQFIEISNEFNRPKKILDAETKDVLWEDNNR